MPYPKYLRTPEWARTRADALHRAGHACALNVTHTQDLESTTAPTSALELSYPVT